MNMKVGEKQSLRNYANSSNRRSQVVGAASNKGAYAEYAKNELPTGHVNMSKMRTVQQSTVQQNSQRYSIRGTLDPKTQIKPPSGLEKSSIAPSSIGIGIDVANN